MSVSAISWVFNEADVHAEDLPVLLAIADSANELGEAWPSLRTIARKSRRSVRTVQRSIVRLEVKGLLARETRFTPTGRQTSSVYRLALLTQQHQNGDILSPMDRSAHEVSPPRVTSASPSGVTHSSCPDPSDESLIESSRDAQRLNTESAVATVAALLAVDKGPRVNPPAYFGKILGRNVSKVEADQLMELAKIQAINNQAAAARRLNQKTLLTEQLRQVREDLQEAAHFGTGCTELFNREKELQTLISALSQPTQCNTPAAYPSRTGGGAPPLNPY